MSQLVGGLVRRLMESVSGVISGQILSIYCVFTSHYAIAMRTGGWAGLVWAG